MIIIRNVLNVPILIVLLVRIRQTVLAAKILYIKFSPKEKTMSIKNVNRTVLNSTDVRNVQFHSIKLSVLNVNKDTDYTLPKTEQQNVLYVKTPNVWTVD